jgi:transcriptional regulator with XRE-family HTH domain
MLTQVLNEAISGIRISGPPSPEALRRFQAIAPLAVPEEFPLVAKQFRRQKLVLARTLAHQAGYSQSTISRWERAYRTGGLLALANKTRADKGRPRFNYAAAEFLLNLFIGSREGFNVAAIHRAYNEEKAWRTAHADHQITGQFELVRYRAWLSEGRLRPEAQLPPCSYALIRMWSHKMPELGRFLSGLQAPKAKRRG